jgi:hypothetical protein
VATVDARAPRLVLDRVRVTLTAPDGTASAAAFPGGTVDEQRLVNVNFNFVASLGNTLVMHRCRGQAATVFGGASLWVTSSCFDDAGFSDAAIVCNDCSALHLFHTSVVNRTNLGGNAAIAAANASSVILGGAIVQMLAAGPAIRLDVVAGATIVGSDIVAASGPLLASGTDTRNSVTALHDCTWAGCALARDNTSVAPLFEAGNACRLSLTSPLADHGVNLAGLGAPASVAADFGGDCRYRDAAADVGPDEL